MSVTTNPYTFTNVSLDDVEFLGVFYQGPSDEERFAYKSSEDHLKSELDQRGMRWDDVIFHRTSQGCAACGTHFFHGAVVLVNGTDAIAIGGICSEKWGVARQIGKAAFNARRARLHSEKKDAAHKDAEEQLAQYPGLAEALEYDHYITEDIASKLWRYGSLSEAQIELVFKLQREGLARDAAQAEREAALAAAPELTEDRQELTGQVISTKSRDGYAYGSTEYKMTVQLDNGNRVWGTIPNSIFDDVWGEAGVWVNFTATIVVSDDDPHFGFFKRPTKATVISREGVN